MMADEPADPKETAILALQGALWQVYRAYDGSKEDLQSVLLLFLMEIPGPEFTEKASMEELNALLEDPPNPSPGFLSGYRESRGIIDAELQKICDRFLLQGGKPDPMKPEGNGPEPPNPSFEPPPFRPHPNT